MTASAGGAGTLRRMGAALLALGRIRVELAVLDWQDETARLTRLLLHAVLAALLAGFTLLALALLLTVALWDGPWRLAALIAVTTGLAAAALYSGWRVGALLRPGSPPFGATLGELRRDEAMLRGEPPGPPR